MAYNEFGSALARVKERKSKNKTKTVDDTATVKTKTKSDDNGASVLNVDSASKSADTTAGADLYQQKQEQIADANSDFKSNLFNMFGMGLAAQDAAGMPEQTELARAQRDYGLAAQEANQRSKELNKATDWEGRDELITRYREAQALANEDVSKENMDRANALREELERRDIAAGNGARSYTGQDRFSNIFQGSLESTASGIANAAGIIGQTTGEGELRREAGSVEQTLRDLRTGDDTRRAAEEALKDPEASAGWQKVYDYADRIGETAAKDLQKAKEGLNSLGQAGVDISTNVIQMGFDAATGALTGGNSLVPMFIRTLGGAAQEARQDGATTGEQLLYGLSKAAIEVGTEKIADGVAGIYGKGAADDITEELIRKLSDSGTGRTMLRVIFGAAGEGGEEVLSDLLSPVAELIYKDPSLIKVEPSEVLYDFLIGAAVGALGGGTSIVTGQNAQKNAALRAQDALAQFNAAEAPQSPVQTQENTQTQAAATAAQTTAQSPAETPAPTTPESTRTPLAQTLMGGQESEAAGLSAEERNEIIDEIESLTRFADQLRIRGDNENRADVLKQIAELQSKLHGGQTTVQAEAPQVEAPAVGTPEGQLRSQSEANTIQALDEQLGVPNEVRNPLYYTPVTEAESVAKARDFLENGYESDAPEIASADLTAEQAASLEGAGARLGGAYGKAIADLQGPGVWSSVQMDMSTLLFEKLAEDAAQTGDWSAYEAWRIIDQTHGTEAARALQARGKRVSVTDIINKTIDQVNSLGIEGDAKAKVLDQALPYAKEIAATLNSAKPDPRTGTPSPEAAAKAAEDLRNIITRISKDRYTGTIIPGELQRLLNKQTDLNYLSDLAQASVRGLAADAVPTDAGRKVKSWQSIAMMLKLTTTMRNLGGNSTFGLMDTLVGDVFGVALDKAVSTQTGKRGVNFDTRWLNKTQRQGARDAFTKAVLETALDADMGSLNTKYVPSTRAFSSDPHKPIQRTLSRAEQILSYALNATDKLYRGGLESGATEALSALNQAQPLTEVEIAEIEKKIREKNPRSKESTIERLVQKRVDEITQQRETALQKDIEKAGRQRADYRLFQNNGIAANIAQSFHDTLNLAGIGGEVRGTKRVGGFGLGDVVTPFARVVSNLGVKSFEYSPLGMAKGVYDMANLLKDAKTGKNTIAQQQNAVMEIARGVTGVPLAIAFAALIKGGLIKRSTDEDDYKVTKARESEGRKETQWNLDATLRALSGGDPEWQEGDKIVSLSWLEPLNAFMDIGALFAEIPEEDDPGFWDRMGYYAKKGSQAYLYGAYESFMEIPMMDNLEQAMRSAQQIDSENILDKLGAGAKGLVKSGTTGMIPGIMAQVARATDPVTRDTSADTFIKELANAAVNQVPGARKNLPAKLDSFGNPIENTNPLLNTLNNLALPGAVSEYAPKEVVQALDEVYRATGEHNFYPDYKAPANITYDGEKFDLTTDEKRTYQETYGNIYDDLVVRLSNSALYRTMTTDMRADAIGKIKSYAADAAKRELVESRGGTYESDYDKIKDMSFSDLSSYIGAKTAIGGAEKARDYSQLDRLMMRYSEFPESVQSALAENSTIKYLAQAHDAGVSSKTFYTVDDKVKNITPAEGSANVSTWQKIGFIANDKDLSDAEKDYFAKRYFTNDGTDAKYDAARTQYTPEQIAVFYEAYTKSNQGKKKTIAAAMDGGLTKQQAESLYQIWKGGK